MRIRLCIVILSITRSKQSGDYLLITQLLRDPRLQQLRQMSGAALEEEYADRLEACLEIHRQQLYLAHEIEQTKGETAVQASFDLLKSVEDIIKNLPKLYAQTHPFAAPVYWAAFTCQGLS